MSSVTVLEVPKSAKRKKRKEKPVTLTAAGLLSFYEDFDAIVTLKPVHVILLAIAFAAAIVALHIVSPY